MFLISRSIIYLIGNIYMLYLCWRNIKGGDKMFVLYVCIICKVYICEERVCIFHEKYYQVFYQVNVSDYTFQTCLTETVRHFVFLYI